MGEQDIKVAAKDAKAAQAAQPAGNGGITFSDVMWALGVGAAPIAARIGARLAGENAPDLMIPNEVQNAVINVTADHVKKNPIRSAIVATGLGPGAVVEDAIAERVASDPRVRAAMGAVQARATSEAIDTGTKMLINPFNPQGVLIEKGINLGLEGAMAEAAFRAQLANQAVQDVCNLPNRARQFDKDRPFTSAVIDGTLAGATGFPLSGVDRVIGTGIKGAAQTASDRLDQTLRFLGIR